MSRFRRPRGPLVTGVLIVSALVGAVLVGCQSGPMRALAGARHYAEGSEALDRGDAGRAIAELEQAARLVPHASEIRNHLGLAYWQAGDTKAARTEFERALELDCENHAARANRDRLARPAPVAAGPTKRPHGRGSDDHGG